MRFVNPQKKMLKLLLLPLLLLKVDQLSGRATYEICYDLSLLPPLPYKPKKLAPETRRFRLPSDLASSHDSASFSKFRNASTNSTSLREITFLFLPSPTPKNPLYI